MKNHYEYYGYRYNDDDDHDDDRDDDRDYHNDRDDDHVETYHPINYISSPTTVVTETTVVVNTVVNVTSAPPDPVTNVIHGTRWNDYLVGTDFDDVIYGYKGNDTLIDNGGSDRLYGGKGKNTFLLSADGVTDVVFVSKDKKADVIKGVELEDRIDIYGGRLSFESTDRGIEIFSKNRLCAIYKGDLSLEQIQSLTI